MSGPRIGIFAHSTNPRGGVVHAMQLCEALCMHGLDATLLAPSVSGAGFYRQPKCRSVLIPAQPVAGDVENLVRTRRSEIANFLDSRSAPRFELLHAQDSISALALSDLVRQRRIPRFVRTVHHLDDFSSPRLAAWQDEAVRGAHRLFCVSRLWQQVLRERFGRTATLVGNGVDCARFTPDPATPDEAMRDEAVGRRLLPDGGRMILALGGIENRKNTIAIVRSFLMLLEQDCGCDLHLVIAGGASLLDHSETRARFDSVLEASDHAGRIHFAGVIDDADMPSLYRNAAMLCFPSLQEGFGLCVLEALACGIPVIAPQGAPFDEYLQPGDAFRVDPRSDRSIADALLLAAGPAATARARAHGPLRAREFSWRQVAQHHLADYARFANEVIEHA